MNDEMSDLINALKKFRKWRTEYYMPYTDTQKALEAMDDASRTAAKAIRDLLDRYEEEA